MNPLQSFLSMIFGGNNLVAPVTGQNPSDNAQDMQLRVGVAPGFQNQQVSQDQSQQQAPPKQVGQQSSQWQSHFQGIYNQMLQKYNLPSEVPQLLVTSENGKEDPNFINKNNNNTEDVGLLQVNASPQDAQKVQALQNPATNIDTGLGIYKQRLQNLGDPLLALASYNYGAGGAVLRPQDSLNRAQSIYQNAGLPMPNTPFSQNPAQYVQQHMDQYKQEGLFK